MATLQHSAPWAFTKALSGARSAVFPATAAILVVVPCDVLRWNLSEGDRLHFVLVSTIEADGLHITHDGEFVMLNLSERSGYWAMVWPDGTRDLLPTRDVASQIAYRMTRREWCGGRDSDDLAHIVTWRRAA